MKVLAVVGSRDFEDKKFLFNILNENKKGIVKIVSGGARGADSFAVEWAKENDIPFVEFLPDWKTHGKQAGFIRNYDIISAADEVVAFWDGISKGTKSSIDIAKRQNKPCTIINYTDITNN